MDHLLLLTLRLFSLRLLVWLLQSINRTAGLRTFNARVQILTYKLLQAAVSRILARYPRNSASLTVYGAIISCLTTNCRQKATQNITKAACGFPVRNRSPSFNATIIALGVATTLITVVRLVFKKFYSQQKVLHPDDWITAVSLALCLSGVAVGIGGLTPAGLGKDIWTLNISKIAKFATYFYAMELIYISGVSLIKLSLTLFYLRVFPGNMIRLFLWGTILLNTLYGVVFGSIAIFQCSPVSYYWDQYSGDAQGHCININLFGWLHAAVGVALDILMLTLPLSQVVRLQLHWKKKLGVSAMFVLGTL